MSSTDILQDVHDKREMPAVRKGRLFLCHIIAIICLGYFGIILGYILSGPDFRSMEEIRKSLETSSKEVKETIFWNRVTSILGYAFALSGGAISYVICRKFKLPAILSISILLYSFIIFYILQKVPYVGFLMPGGYLFHYFDWHIGPYVNLVYVLVIALFLFFSKRIKNWYTKAVVE